MENGKFSVAASGLRGMSEAIIAFAAWGGGCTLRFSRKTALTGGKLRLALFGLAAAFALAACSPDEPTPKPTPYVPTPIEPVSQDSVLLAGKYYLPRVLQYYDGFYPAMGEDCVVLHLEFIIDGANTGAGMTVEISRELLGQTIEFAPSDEFWFFHTGTGQAYLMMQNDDTPFNSGHTGHFKIDLGDAPDEVFFEWTLSDADGLISEGTLNEPFERLTTL